MPTEFKLPELGENVTAGDVVRVLVSVGDTIAKEQPLLELETDKATIEVPSSVAGTVKDVRIKPGDTIKVGQVVLTVEDGASGKETAAAGQAAPAATSSPPPPQTQAEEPADEPSAGNGGAKEEKRGRGGAAGAKERGLGRADLPESQKADTAAESKPKRGEVVDISRAARAAAPQPAAEPAAPEGDGPAAPAAPSVRRLARELGVDIRRVSGSGPGGRISAEDLQGFVRGAMGGGGGAGAAEALRDFTKWGEVERRPMSNIRRKTAEHLSRAWTTIPHVTQHDKADVTAVEALRKQHSPKAEQAGGKMTMTAIALKIVAGALQRFPQFNASADMARNEIVYRKSIHVGVGREPHHCA